MGLSDVSENSVKSKQGSGSSSSSSGGGYPKSRVLIPAFAFYRVDDQGNPDPDGELVAEPSPQNQFIEERKEDKNSRWERVGVAEELERYWMDWDSVRLLAHNVEKQLGADFWTLVKQDPEKALRAVKEAAQLKGTSREVPQTRDCAVCGEELHDIYGDYQEVNHKRVCSDHSVEELTEADIL